MQAHANTHTFFLTQYACRRTLPNLVSFLRQILGWNSICWGDELCDRVEREETRMKGQEKMRRHTSLVFLFFVSFYPVCVCVSVCVTNLK